MFVRAVRRAGRGAAALGLAIAMCAVQPEAHARTGEITLVQLPDKANFVGPDKPIVGPDGNIWFVEYGTGKIAFVVPHAPYTVREFTLPAASTGIAQITVVSDGNIWYASTGTVDYRLGGTPGTFGKILTHEPYTITQASAPFPAYSLARISAGPDGNVWTVAFPAQGAPPGSTNRIIRINPTSGSTTSFISPANLVGYLLPGHAHDFWFYGQAGTDKHNVIGRFFLSDPTRTTTFDVPGGGGPGYVGPTDLIWGHDGNIWFPDWMSINQLSPNATPTSVAPIRQIAVFPQVVGLAFGPDRSVWFTEENFATIAIGRLDRRYPYHVTAYPLVAPSGITLGPNHIVLGPDGNLWATVIEVPKGGAIARIEVTPSGAQR